MIFGKKRQSELSRRQPAIRDAAPSPVFSYHSRAARTDSSGMRSANKAPWSSAAQPSPRGLPNKWSRRVPAVALAVLAVAFVISNLILGREPAIIALADTGNRRVFLRSENTYREAASTILAGSFANTNKLTIDTKNIAAAMQKQFPELEHVSVTLPVIGRRPALYIQPARPVLLLKSADGGVFVVDAAGRALINASQASAVGKLGLPIAEDQSGLPIKLGQIALPSDNIAFITEVVGQLRAKKITISGLVLPKATNELDVRIEGAPYTVKFNLRGDARAEAGAYLAVKQHFEREHKTPGSYVDVRVDNKVYYR